MFYVNFLNWMLYLIFRSMQICVLLEDNLQPVSFGNTLKRRCSTYLPLIEYSNHTPLLAYLIVEMVLDTGSM